jgi:cyclopropane fatty-acyl-phospholipid synthase-like methyltransferase
MDPATDPPAVLFVAFVETPQDIVDRMLKMARVTKDDVVCDLGCGDGRIVVTAAKRYGCRAVGYDLDPLRVEEARENAEQSGVAHLITIEQKDVLTVDLEEVSVVTIYMGTEMNARLIPQLSRLKPGARIVSHEFGLGNIPPDKTVEMTSRDSGRRHKIHLWTCPLRSANP